MANSVDEICRYMMIIQFGYFLLFFSVLVHAEQDETAKTHVGKCIERAFGRQ